MIHTQIPEQIMQSVVYATWNKVDNLLIFICSLRLGIAILTLFFWKVTIKAGLQLISMTNSCMCVSVCILFTHIRMYVYVCMYMYILASEVAQ